MNYWLKAFFHYSELTTLMKTWGSKFKSGTTTIHPFFSASSFTALMKAINKGCGRLGRDKNSGWN